MLLGIEWTGNFLNVKKRHTSSMENIKQLEKKINTACADRRTPQVKYKKFMQQTRLGTYFKKVDCADSKPIKSVLCDINLFLPYFLRQHAE